MGDVSHMDLVQLGEPAVIMSVGWDWWNLVFVAVVVCLLIGAFYFGRSEGAGNGGAEGGASKGSSGK